MQLLKLWFSIVFGLIRFALLVFLGWVIAHFTGFGWFESFVVLALVINCIEHIAIDVKDK